MKRVLVTLVSLGLLAGLAALVPILAGDPASAATPCASQHRHVVTAQKKVKQQKTKLAKDRRHHKAKAVKKDRKQLAAAKRKAHNAQMRYRLCRANHKPAKTVTASPSPSDTSSGAPTSLPTDPAALCALVGLPADCLGASPTATPTSVPDLCSTLGLPSDCLTALPTDLPTGSTGTAPTSSAATSSSSALPTELPSWLTALYPDGVPEAVIDALISQFGSIPQTAPANPCLFLGSILGLLSGDLPATC